MTEDLKDKKCVPCEGGVPSMTKETIATYISRLKEGWEVIEDKKIRRKFKFKNFKEAMNFVNRIADVAENEGHHPDIHISWNRVTLELTTHAIGGLSENDFIMAAKIDMLEL